MLFIAGGFVTINTPAIAIQRVISDTTTARSVRARAAKPTTPARSVITRTATTNRASRTSVPTRNITNDSSTTTRRKQTTTQQRALTRAATLNTTPKTAGSGLSLVRMYVPESLRTANIRKYIDLSATGAESGFMTIILNKDNTLPDFSTLFAHIGSSKIDGVYNTNNTSGTKIIDSTGKPSTTPTDNMYMIAASGTGGGGGTGGDTPGTTCSTNTDCGAGTCNSGTCTCFEHAEKANNKCACSNGYVLNSDATACTLPPPTDDPDNMHACTNASDEIRVPGSNKCVKAKLTLTTLSYTKGYISFAMTAIGTFYVDWGDGSPVEQIISTTLEEKSYSHEYSGEASRKIRFGGTATGGYSDTEPPISFRGYGNACDYIVNVTGSLGELFPMHLGMTNPVPKFKETFRVCKELLSIPDTLFSGLTTTTPGMFEGTFEYCSKLTKIPAGLFSSITDAPIQPNLFKNTFAMCKNVTSIPENLFYGVSGDPVPGMFEGTFGATGIATIPENLFSGISGAPAEYMFKNTFSNTQISTIPENLFSGISGAPAPNMFSGTFSTCKNLAAIPANLFRGISGKPATYMFGQTFEDTGITSIPENLFSGISGAPATSMFFYTFAGCSKLTSLPAGLFSGIIGPTAGFMYKGTFSGCSGLTGNIPDGLFGRLYGPTSSYMFSDTFEGCSNLTGTVPSSMYKNIHKPTSGSGNVYVYDSAFYRCNNMATECPGGTYLDPAANDFKDQWDGHVACTNDAPPATQECEDDQFAADGMCVEPKFTVTTTSDTNHFAFTVSFKGLLFVDWGDGKTQVLAQNDNSITLYEHYYTTRGEHKIRFAAQPVEYPYGYAGVSNGKRIISFATYTDDSGNTYQTTPDKVKSVSGSLAELFPTIPGASEDPTFVYTFTGCSNLESIPAELFRGATKPTKYMFFGTFENCTKITSIPETLFAGISGAPAADMFNITFRGCTSITSIPENLFASIHGELAKGMFAGTFKNCTGLRGQIPNNLFAGLSGTGDYSFNRTFENCTGLTGYVPESYYVGKNDTGSTDTFKNTGLATKCEPPLLMDSRAPKGSNGASVWDYHVACHEPCPENTIDGHIDGLTCVDPEFTIVTTPDTTEFGFALTAAGTFYIDCGDGGDLSDTNDNTIVRQTETGSSAQKSTYKCTYSNAGAHIIRFGGEATAYTSVSHQEVSAEPAAITFYGTQSEKIRYTQNIASVSGSLASIFPQLGPGITKYPRFVNTFRNAQIKEIPETLFNGLTGGSNMFFYTFAGNSNLTTIPDELFSTITTGASYMFESTFRDCTSLTDIPNTLFDGIETIPTNASYMFEYTFADCTGLTALPDALFKNITTAAPGMFSGVFHSCTNMGGYIPAGTFAGLIAKGCPTASNMWNHAFTNTQLASTFCPSGTTRNTDACYDNNGSLSSPWQGKISCVPD